jgi:hypothetical protein
MLGRFSSGFSGLLLPVFFLGLTGYSAAQPSPGEVSARERTDLAQSFVTEKLWVWQRRLNLDEWKVAIEVVRATDLKPKTLGNIHWDTDKKIAVIHVLDPADYKLPFHEMLDDMEFTVVHELIHLELAPVLSPFARSDANRRDEEHAVNHVADALLHLDRGR